MKKLTVALLTLLAALGCAQVKVTVSTSLKVAVNGEYITFAGTGPRRVQGRVLIPLRGVLEKIGATVGWDAATKTVTAKKADIDLSMKIGEKSAIVNGNTIVLEVPAMIIDGTTMVPLRFVGEALGAEVIYGGGDSGGTVLNSAALVGVWYLLDSDDKFVKTTKITFTSKGEFFFVGSAWKSQGKFTLTTEGINLVWVSVDGKPVTPGSMKKTLPLESSTRMQLDRFRYGKFS